MSGLFSSGFSNIDGASEPEECVRFVDDANAMASFLDATRHSHEMLALRAGDRVLDVSCGAADDVRALARIVGPTGRAVGVDGSAVMIAAARRRAAADPLLTAYHIGDARRLDFVDDTFDGCRTDRVLQHLDDPGRAIGELVRVAKPGGRIVAVEPDRETLLVDAPNRDVTRKILHVRCDAARNGWTGRQLPRLFKERGLTDIRDVPLPSVRTAYQQTVASLRLGYYAQQAREAGIVTAAEAAAWTGALEETGKAGCFFCAVTLFRVAGRKC